MLKPKVALVKDGFLPPGSENKRGRLSADAIERCKTLASQGWDIEGYEAKGATVERVAVVSGAKTIADIGMPTRDETVLRAMAGKVDVGMRTICANCRASFTYCRCESPRVNLDYDRQAVVTFVPKSG